MNKLLIVTIVASMLACSSPVEVQESDSSKLLGKWRCDPFEFSQYYVPIVNYKFYNFTTDSFSTGYRYVYTFNGITYDEQQWDRGSWSIIGNKIAFAYRHTTFNARTFPNGITDTITPTTLVDGTAHDTLEYHLFSNEKLGLAIEGTWSYFYWEE